MMIRARRLMVVLLMALAVCGCQKEGKKQAAQAVIPVKVTKVEFKDLEETVDYVGNVRAQEEAVIYPRVNGKIIEKIKEDGSPVNKDEVVAFIDRDEVGFKFEKAPVESPLTGIIGRVYVDIGENVTTQTPIALVVDMRRVEIDIDVPEKYYSKIALNQKARVRVDAYPAEEFTGKVKKISPIVDLSTRAAPIEIVIDNPQGKLRSGMFSKVNLVLAEHKNVPVVLKEAILGKEPNLYVYVVENNKAVIRKITVGVRQGPHYEVTSGLSEGDLVVIMGQQKLYDKVQVIWEEEKA